MTNFTARFAGIATLALAVVPVAALSTLAHAAPVPAHVRIGDLDLGSRAGLLAFDRRVAKASESLCGSQRLLSVKSACEAAIRTEAHEKLALIAAS